MGSPTTKAALPRVRVKAREYADRICITHPGVHTAWGIAYDAYITAVEEMARSSTNVSEDDIKLVEKLLRLRYSFPRIVERVGLEMGTVKAICKAYQSKLS